MASNTEEPHKPTTRSQATDRKRSISSDVNDTSSVTKKRSIDMQETSSSNQTTDDTTTTLSEDPNTDNKIPDDMVELFEEVDGKGIGQDTAESGQEIDIESFETPTGTTEAQETTPNPANEQPQASESTEPTETLAPKATLSNESPGVTADDEAKKPSDEESQHSGSAMTSIPIDKNAMTGSVDNVSSTNILDTALAGTQTSRKHPSGLGVPDKSSSVRQPFSDKFFFSDEAYEAYSHDSFMANIDSITKKNKPGLALSLERPTSSISRPTSMQSAHQHLHSQQQQRPPYLHGTTNASTIKPSSAASDNNRTINPPAAANNNILDSLLDSISKNDRPIVKPAHVPSDIEIAMQAADLPPTQPKE